MTGNERGNWFEELMDRSSLGGEGADALSARTSDDILAAILHRRKAEEMFDQLDQSVQVYLLSASTDDEEDDLGPLDTAARRRRSW